MMAERVDSRWIPYGRAGIDATVRRMVELARTPDPAVANAAWQINASVPPPRRAMALRAWIEAHFVYGEDPWGGEVLQTPGRMIRQVNERGYAIGDCDCVATLTAALALALGIPAAYVLVSRPGADPHHVYVVLGTENGWYPVDPTPGPRDPAHNLELVSLPLVEV